MNADTIAAVDWRARPLLGASSTGSLDRRAAEQGQDGFTLMTTAGRSVAAVIMAELTPRPTLVLCGPGNNGGDGWIVAATLAGHGWPVSVCSLVDAAALRGDAARARAGWGGPVAPFGQESLPGECRLVVDALFGVGLKRPVERDAAKMIRAVNERRKAGGLAVFAIDVPSGVDADDGQVHGLAIEADATISFVTAKPGHLLMPGRLHCGRLEVVDIGIGQDLVAGEPAELRVNSPALWRHLLPRRTETTHKYSFGHGLVMGGPLQSTGASRLSALAALRIGAGLVSVATNREALPIYAATLLSVMTKLVEDDDALHRLLADERLNAVLIGPGAGVSDGTAHAVRAILERRSAAIIDADALTVLGKDETLRALLHDECVLTPHEGEFKRVFPDLEGSRLRRAQEAARRSGAVIVLKGSDTIVAAPDGRAAMMAAAPPSLATAGTGDVLAGLATGLLAQHMPPFEGAAAAVWIHAAAAERHQDGLIAEDLPATAAAVLAALARQS